MPVVSFNDSIIDEFRRTGGTVEQNGFGRSLVLVHNVGARTGEEYVTPLLAIEDDGDWLIAASAAGASRHPAWYGNLLARPEVTIEVPGDGRPSTVPVTVVDLAGAVRDAAWARFIGRSPAFGSYEEKAAPRVIPVLRLRRR